MRVLVIGAAGQVGRRLLERGDAQGDSMIGTFNSRKPTEGRFRLEHLDKSDGAEVGRVLEAVRPEVVVDTGALHNVDYCESHPDEASRVNREGTRHVAEAARAAGARFVFVSTDFVFDGRLGRAYRETDPPNPQSEYARSKLEGERETLQSSASNLVVRPSVIYSWIRTDNLAESSSGKGLNFGTWLVEEVRRGKPVRIVSDQIASPTLADDLANSILALIRSKSSGVYHAAGRTAINRFEFSRQLVKRLGLDPELVRPVTTAELNQRAARPANSSLDSSRFAEVTGRPTLDLDQELDQFAAEFHADPGVSSSSPAG